MTYQGGRRRQAITFALLWAVASASEAQLPSQPYVGYWKPAEGNNSLGAYDLATDPDAPFNVGSVPLAGRFTNPALQANPNARAGEARIMSLAAFAPTSDNPSQGSDQARYYAFSNWQYVDALVFWGGSAGEGNILAPNGPVIDAAHRNGVPVYGNIFFPPSVFGGDIDRVDQLTIRRRDGSFPLADKLIEVAEHNRFDGWFFNQETEGASSTLASETRDFLRYMQDNSDLEIVWYDSMVESGPIAWQGGLNNSNNAFYEDPTTGRASDSMFLDFRWNSNSLVNSANYANSLGRDQYELYAGVNVEGAGWNQTGEPLDQIFPAGQPHRTSAGLYRPEWTERYASSVETFHSRDTLFWSGPGSDPSDTTRTIGSAGWKGIANYVVEKSAVSGDSFVTNFNVGQGFNYWVDGESKRQGDWNNLSLQDVMPTWRWLVDSSARPLRPEFDFTDAYYGGSSLRVYGGLNARNDLRLYMTNLPVAEDSNFQIALKTGESNAPTNVEVLLAFTDDPETFISLPLGDSTTSDWDLRTLPLGDHAGKTIAQIGLRFDGAEPSIDVNIGRLGVIQGDPDTPEAPTAVTLSDHGVINQNAVTLRLHWEHSQDYSPDASNEVYYYNLYHVMENGEREFLGGTLNNSFFVRDLQRDQAEALSKIEVIAVGNEFGVSEAATYFFNWDNPGGLAGDFNNDGIVNAADYTVWRDNLGASERGNVLNGNGNGGVVDQADYDLWRANYGSTASAAKTEAVPEPSAIMLLVYRLANP